ncbi:hypothetical protein VU05_03870 [Desulfobulbus sp. F1]|nr:hypothetical protein [Desulfobulbus sp. F1]
MCIKKTIIGYIPAVIIFAGPVSAGRFHRLLCSSWLDYSSCHGEFNSAALCVNGILFLSFVIGGILNLAFLIYAIDDYFLEDVLRDGSTSEGIISIGGVVTAISTLVIQLGIILSLFNLLTWYLDLIFD